MQASPLGKGKMACQVAAILLLILGHDGIPWFTRLGHVALWLVVVMAAVSAADYYRRFMRASSSRQS